MPELPDHLETTRLLLRPITQADLDFFVELHALPTVVRFLGGGGKTRTREATTEWLRVLQGEYEHRAVGQYAVVRKADSTLIGRSGFSYFELDEDESIPRATWGLGSARGSGPHPSILEVGYVIDPRFWGQGYATEAAGGWYAHALGQRGARSVSSLIHPENSASQRVAAKNGLELSGEVLLDGSRYDWHQLERATPED